MMEAIEAAIDFVDGRDRADLDSDRQLLFAIVHAIEIAGEAAARISLESRARAPDVPWQSIVSMRNRLIHGYFDIDRSIVWKTAQEELPALLPALRALIEKG
jgi:uncharacterized protein with HEPN domain